jgi:hypothetical protein
LIFEEGVRIVKLKASVGAVAGVVVLVAVLLLTSGALARSNSLSPGQFTISGDVKNKVVYSTAQLAALPNQQTETVSFIGPGGSQTHTETGPLLWDVVNNVVQPDWADSTLKNAVLRYFVEAIGSDQYAAIVAGGEIDPFFGNKPVLLAVSEDGQPLAQPRLIVPGDVHGGRYVSDTVGVVIGEAPTQAPNG